MVDCMVSKGHYCKFSCSDIMVKLKHCLKGTSNRVYSTFNILMKSKFCSPIYMCRTMKIIILLYLLYAFGYNNKIKLIINMSVLATIVHVAGSLAVLINKLVCCQPLHTKEVTPTWLFTQHM